MTHAETQSNISKAFRSQKFNISIGSFGNLKKTNAKKALSQQLPTCSKSNESMRNMVEIFSVQSTFPTFPFNQMDYVNQILLYFIMAFVFFQP
jgi:hypothetical protein